MVLLLFWLTGPAQRVLQKRRKTRRKLQILTFLTIYFSCKSDEYSIIYKPLKIKFQISEFEKFLEIIEFSRKFREIEKCSEIEGNSKQTETPFMTVIKTDIIPSNHLLFILIRQIFDHIQASKNKVSGTTISEISQTSKDSKMC